MEIEIKSIIGMRTIKTVIAIIITTLFMKYVFNETPFFACIGALVSVEKSISSSIKVSIIRNIGTIVGGVTGIIFSTISQNLFFLSCGIIPHIYFNNKIGKKESIVPGGIVYFSVIYLNNSNMTVLNYGIRRILGTIFGTMVGLAVNYYICRPKEDTL